MIVSRVLREDGTETLCSHSVATVHKSYSSDLTFEEPWRARRKPFTCPCLLVERRNWLSRKTFWTQRKQRPRHPFSYHHVAHSPERGGQDRRGGPVHPHLHTKQRPHPSHALSSAPQSQEHIRNPSPRGMGAWTVHTSRFSISSNIQSSSEGRESKTRWYTRV